MSWCLIQRYQSFEVLHCNPRIFSFSVLVVFMLTVSSASFIKGMDDAVIRRRGSLWREESFKSVTAQPERISLVWYKWCWIGQVWSCCVLVHDDISVISHLHSGSSSLRERAKSGGVWSGLTPQRAHRLQRGLPVDTQKCASVKAELAACLWSAGFLFRAPGDLGSSPASGCPGQNHVDQSTQQQAHEHR